MAFKDNPNTIPVIDNEAECQPLNANLLRGNFEQQSFHRSQPLARRSQMRPLSARPKIIYINNYACGHGYTIFIITPQRYIFSLFRQKTAG